MTTCRSEALVFSFFFRSCLSVIFIHLFAFMGARLDSCTNHVDMFGVCALLPPPSARHLKEKVTLVMCDLLQLDRVESHKRTYSQVFLFLKSHHSRSATRDMAEWRYFGAIYRQYGVLHCDLTIQIHSNLKDK